MKECCITALSDMPWYNTSVLKNEFKKYMLQCGGMENNMKKVEDYVRSIPDFPEKGIIFRDITSVIQDPEGLKLAN